MSIPVTVCPPYTESSNTSTARAEHFDAHQFFHPHSKMVSQLTRIAFQDSQSMHLTGRRRNAVARRKPLADWILNEAMFRETILVYLERQNGLVPVPGATNEERIAEVKLAALARLPRMKANLDRLLERYKATGNPSTVELQNMDTQVCTAHRVVELAVAVPYFSYHLGYNATEVAEEFHIKPPAVRMTLWRMNKIGALVQQGLPAHCRPKRWYTDEEIETAIRLRSEGKTQAEIDAALGRRGSLITLRHLGIVLPPVPPHLRTRRNKGIPRIWNDERMAYVAALRADGKTWKQIASLLSRKGRHATSSCCMYYNALLRRRAHGNQS